MNRRSRLVWCAVVVSHLLALVAAPKLLPRPMDPYYIQVWMTMVLERGLTAAYGWDDAEVKDRFGCEYNVNYPPTVLYLYLGPALICEQLGGWPAPRSQSANLLVRAPLAVFHLAVVWALTRRRVTEPAGLDPTRTAILIGLNPVLLLLGPVWGQLDVLLWAAMTLSVLAAARGAGLAAGGWAAVGVITKPQSLLFAPVLIAVALRRRRATETGMLLAAFVAGVAVLTAPFLATTGLQWAERGYSRVFDANQTAVTVTGYNVWWLVREFAGVQTVDDRMFGMSAKRLGMVAAGLIGGAAGLVYVFGRRTRSPLGLMTIHLTGCFLFLTGMHERFLVYGAASAALWAAADRRAVPAAVLLGLAQLLNLPVNTVNTTLPPAGVTAVCSATAVLGLAGLVAAGVALFRPSPTWNGV
jgi:dolichyl-phosphate-mannose-protein mannosyltransferase